jgi:DNA-binding NarL/FixJ family response regulator
VVFVEDHEDFRKSLEHLLNSSERFACMSFADAPSALLALERERPDVVIMDLNLEGPNGIACTRTIKEYWPEVQVLVCTVHEDDDRIFGALKAGATGYILKRAPIGELLDAIEQVHEGGSPMSAGIARKVVNSFQELAREQSGEKLTVREEEILDLLAEGLRFKEIADKLFVSINTVRTHVRHIYEKLQVQSRVEALNKARRAKF